MALKVLSLSDVQKCIDMSQAISVMEEAFNEYHQNKTILPLRTPVPVEKEHAMMLTMPAYLSQQNALGLKVVSIFPGNAEKNKPAINGALLLINEETGEAKAIMEAGYLTALRTGAVSGLATKFMAPENAEHVAIIGSGVQAMTQLEAVTCVRPIKQVSIWSRNFDNSRIFAHKIEGTYRVECYKTVHDAVKDADIICTATGSTSPLIDFEDLKEEVHINAVGSHTLAMCEINNNVMSQAMIVVDQLEAALAESGEVAQAIIQGCIRLEDILELGAIIGNAPTTRTHKVSLFKSVGLAIQDISIAHAVYNNSVQKGLGTSLELNS